MSFLSKLVTLLVPAGAVEIDAWSPLVGDHPLALDVERTVGVTLLTAEQRPVFVGLRLDVTTEVTERRGAMARNAKS